MHHALGGLSRRSGIVLSLPRELADNYGNPPGALRPHLPSSHVRGHRGGPGGIRVADGALQGGVG